MACQVDPEALKQKLAPVFKDEGCDFVLLGGSQAAGTAGWWSDIDIFLHFPHVEEDKIKVERNMRLARVIMTLAGMDCIDLHDIDTLPVHVQYSVVRGSIVLFEIDDGTSRAGFVEKMLRQYYEFAPWYESIINERLQD
nr:nucleotidyltransferase domain-containing protein [Candidatus Sigynarchaeum springense]MDO8118243.1 nucleotidyltransferase domain-containing protein [Candidatus Sigynarchaeota archaeon]